MTNEEKSEKAKNYLATYERVQKYFEIHNDHYFKRTQILMIVIQSALFVAFAKLAGDSKTQGNPLLRVSFLVIPLLGVLSAYAWATLIHRQHSLLEFCRCYLRGIEYRLEDLGVPLAYFRYEADVFHRSSWHCRQQYVSFGYDENEFPHLRSEGQVPPDGN